MFVCLFVFFSTQQISKASNEAKKEETIERFDSIVWFRLVSYFKLTFWSIQLYFSIQFNSIQSNESGLVYLVYLLAFKRFSFVSFLFCLVLFDCFRLTIVFGCVWLHCLFSFLLFVCLFVLFVLTRTFLFVFSSFSQSFNQHSSSLNQSINQSINQSNLFKMVCLFILILNRLFSLLFLSFAFLLTYFWIELIGGERKGLNGRIELNIKFNWLSFRFFLFSFKQTNKQTNKERKKQNKERTNERKSIGCAFHSTSHLLLLFAFFLSFFRSFLILIHIWY